MYDKTGWRKRADGREYVLYTQPHYASLKAFAGLFVATLAIGGLLILGWLLGQWYNTPGVIVTPRAVSEVTTSFPTPTSIAGFIQTEVAALYTATATEKPAVTATATATNTAEEELYATLDHCDQLVPSRTPVPCIKVQTAVPTPTSAPATQTPMPVCKDEPPLYGAAIATRICLLVDPIIEPLW